MSKYSRCEDLPTDLPEVGVLYVAPSLAHTRGTLRRLLWESGLPFGAPLDGILAVEVTPEDLRHLCELLSEGLSAAELRACQTILVDKGPIPGPGMLSQMQDLATLTAVVQSEWLLGMLREDRLVVHFQPIVSAADPSEVFAYECLLRGLDGEGALVSPKRMFGAARKVGLLFNLDQAARTKAIEESSGLQLASKIFINFSPASIHDPTYCLRSAIDAIERSNLSPEQIVFEVTESEKIKDGRHLRNILDFCRKNGFRVALDDLGVGYGLPRLLGALRPNFVKLDVSLVQGVARDPYRSMIASEILVLARELGVAVVAEGVETEEQWRWLATHGAEFVQGYFFAKPAFPPSIPAPACA